MAPRSEQTLRHIARDLPRATVVFDHFGLDYCHMEDQLLSEACLNLGIPIEDLERALEEAECQQEREHIERVDWRERPLPVLIRHIVTTHHEFTRQQVDAIADLLKYTVESHGRVHPELVTLDHVFQSFALSLLKHLDRQEHETFPAIEQLDTEVRQMEGAEPLRNDLGIDLALQDLEAENQQISRALKTMRAVTRNYAVPIDACIRHQNLFDALQRLERDFNQHLHLENHILFPHARKLQRHLKRFLDVA